MTRLLCTGDLHLGKGAQYSDDRLGEQEAVWARILELAEEHAVDAVLVAGDIFEGPLPTPEHYRAFSRPISNADPAFTIAAVLGNGRHDAAMRDATALDVVGINLTLSKRPQLLDFRDCTVATLPWTPITRKVAAQDGGDRDDVNLEAAQQLVAVARDLYDKAPSDRPCVLLGHWTLSGWSTPTGMDTSLLRDVVLPSDELGDIGFDACVFGHIHRGGIVYTGVTPASRLQPIFYVGSPMPLDFGEAACDHGCWLLTVGDGSLEALEFLPIESRRFVTLDLAMPSIEIPRELSPEEVDVVDGSIVKLRYTATREQARRIDNTALRQALLGAGAHRVYIEPTIQREQRSRVAGLDENVSDSDALDLWLAAQEIDAARASTLREQHSTYAEALA